MLRWTEFHVGAVVHHLHPGHGEDQQQTEYGGSGAEPAKPSDAEREIH